MMMVSLQGKGVRLDEKGNVPKARPKPVPQKEGGGGKRH